MATNYVSPKYISTADTAKEIRKVLKAKFPGTKFSVRSKSYSGGCSIDISWIDGPTSSAVDSEVSFFQGADFDGMQDLKEYREPVMWKGERVKFCADYIFTSRNFTVENFAKGLEAAMKKYGIEERPEIKVSSMGNPYLDRGNAIWNHFDIGDLTYQELCQMDFTGKASNESKPKAAAKAQPAVAADKPAIAITENEEKDGVEIRFAAKPDDYERELMKMGGFKATKNKQTGEWLWYAKRSPETLALAASLAKNYEAEGEPVQIGQPAPAPTPTLAIAPAAEPIEPAAVVEVKPEPAIDVPAAVVEEVGPKAQPANVVSLIDFRNKKQEVKPEPQVEEPFELTAPGEPVLFGAVQMSLF